MIRNALKLLPLIALGLGGAIWTSPPAMPSFEKAKENYSSSDLLLLDRQGKALHQVRMNKDFRSLEWVPLGEISPALVSALLKSEDQRFYSHGGVDYKSLASALYQALFKAHFRGASTLSMQTAKLLYPNKDVWKGIAGKIRQFRAAYNLESHWTKNQIMETYLNQVPFRGETVGVSAVSKALFKKDPRGLDTDESALLAVMIRSPNAHEKLIIRRACLQEPERCANVTALALQTLKQNKSIDLEVKEAYHLARRLKDLPHQGHVQTTINLDLQKFAMERAQSQVRSLKSQNVHDAAIFVVENATGEVWAYVGGSGKFSSAPYVDGVTSLRQAGSTLKPFLYATAFENKILTPESWIEDSAVDIVFDRGVYKPQNHDKTFYGWVRAETALASSLNVPAVKVYKLLGDDSFWQKLNKMGFRNLEEADHYGPALALGVADVTLESLTLGYRTLAQHGFYSAPTFLKNQKNPKPVAVFSEESAREVSEILSQKEFRSLGFGLESTLSSVSGAAVKTGTSKDMRDNWCVGYNDRFTVGVWIGNFNGEPMWNVMGVTGAAPLWAEVMQWLQRHYPGPQVKDLKLAKKDSEPPLVYGRAKILYPQDGMVLALDPEIPSQNQKVPFLAESLKGYSTQWRVNNKAIVAEGESYLWTPSRGRHHIELLQNGVAKQKIEIFVK